MDLNNNITTLATKPKTLDDIDPELLAIQPGTKRLVFDFSAMPALPDFAAFDPLEGAGAGAWIDCYISYAKNVSPMTPDLFHESAGLFLASVAVARRLVLPMAYGDIYPNLFILWVANTTLYRKSTALTVTRNLARDVFPFLLAAQDTTPEAFYSDLAGIQPTNFNTLPLLDQQAWENERNYSAQRGWVLDELSGLLAGAGRDYMAGLMEGLLRLYDCDALFTRSTMGRGRIQVKNSYLSMIGASTPAAMADHIKSERLWSNGWWPRFAILTPEARPTWQQAVAINRPSDLEGQLKKLFNRLPNSHKWPESPGALTVSISPEAFGSWNNYNKALSNDLLNDDLPGQLWGAYGRLPTHALKIAMLLAALDWQDTPAPRIEKRHMIRALSIAETWRASTHRAIVNTTETEFNRLAGRIIKIISKSGPEGASFREVCKAMQDQRPGELQATVWELVSAGQVIANSTSGNGKPGRPTERYTLAIE
jgi:hypothetical protein